MHPGGNAVYPLGIIGVGNTLAGDDGAGNIVVSRLMEKYKSRSDVFMHNLQTDPLELWDILPSALRFIFIDAVAGRPAGRLVMLGKDRIRRAWSPSLHNMDLSSVIMELNHLRGGYEPDWNIWGITIDIPDQLHEGLSERVSRAVNILVDILSERIESEDYRVTPPETFERF